eukprot:3375299-Rhodomonas_salina.1
MNARDKKRKSYSLGLDPAAKPKKPEAKDTDASAPTNINVNIDAPARVSTDKVVSVDGASSAQVPRIYETPRVDILGAIKPASDTHISAAQSKSSLLGMDLNRGVQARDRRNAQDKKRKSYSLGLDPAAKPKKPETKIESVSKPDSIPDQAAPAKPAMELDTTPSMRADTVNPTAAALSLSMLTPSPEATVASAVAAAKACAKAMGLPAVQEAVAEEKMRVKEVLTHVAPVEALPTKTKASSSQVLRRAAKEAAAEKEEEPVLRTTELEEVPPPPPVEAFDAEKERALAEKELELEEKARIAAAKVEEVARKVAEQEAKLLKMRAEQQRKEMERWAKAAAAEMEEKEEKKKLDKDSADTVSGVLLNRVMAKDQGKRAKREAKAHAESAAMLAVQAARGAAAEEEEAKVVLAAEEAEAEADEKQWYDLTDEDVARRSEETVSLRRDEEAPQASPPAPRVAAGLGQGLALTMAAGVACVSGAWGAVAAGIGSVQEIGAALIVALSVSLALPPSLLLCRLRPCLLARFVSFACCAVESSMQRVWSADFLLSSSLLLISPPLLLCGAGIGTSSLHEEGSGVKRSATDQKWIVDFGWFRHGGGEKKNTQQGSPRLPATGEDRMTWVLLIVVVFVKNTTNHMVVLLRFMSLSRNLLCPLPFPHQGCCEPNQPS